MKRIGDFTIKLLILGLGLLFLGLNAVLAQRPTGIDIIRKYKKQERSNDAYSEIEMKIINSRGRIRERKVKGWTKYNADDTREQLIKFTSPGDIAGTGFLSVEQKDREDDNWLYLPALRKTRRIAGANKTDQFVGTDFTYEDLESEKPDQYAYQLTGEDNVNSLATWVVEAKPKTDERKKETAYGKRELWIDKQYNLLIQAKLYNKDGDLVKILKAGDIRQVPGSDKWRTYEMTMENIGENSKTVLTFTHYKIDQGIPDDYFTQRYLERSL